MTNNVQKIRCTVLLLAALCLLLSAVSAATPAAGFSGMPRYGAVPLAVSFTDLSAGSPTGWAWYFGDETYTKPWIRVNAAAPWSPRQGQSNALMPDGSIILMGGYDGTFSDDVWRSTTMGRTWTLINASPGWAPRDQQTSLVMPDGSIILMGGYSGISYNDVWRSDDGGFTWRLINASAGWSPRSGHATVLMPDGSIVLAGGWSGAFYPDTWRSADAGATWTLMNASSGWSGRCYHSMVVLPDSSIVLTGGDATNTFTNETWRSADAGASWTLVNASSGWSRRYYHTDTVLPDGSILLFGGSSIDGFTNDMWRSKDRGATWSRLNASAGWPARGAYTRVLMPDGNLVMMGGWNYGYFNDIWRFQTASSKLQNPSHVYTVPGKYPVTLLAGNSDGSGTLKKSGYITAVNLPTVTAVSPASGPTSGGTVVTITGSRFSGATAVRFGTTPGTILSVNSSTRITAQAPAHAAGSVDISVTTPPGTSMASAADAYTYVSRPQITGIFPVYGAVFGGTRVTITGTGLINVRRVLFGNTSAFSASDALVVSGSVLEAAPDGTRLTVISPPHASGVVHVRVTTPGGTSPFGPADRFLYSFLL